MLEAIVFLLPAFTACLIIASLLGYLGLHVLKREIIFIDIALAQIAATGATIASYLHLGGEHSHEHQSVEQYALSVICTLIAAAFFSFVALKVRRLSQETVIGVSYAIAAAATLFLLGIAAGSDVHLGEMFTGSILWVEWSDFACCAPLYFLVGLFHYIFRKRFINITEHHEHSCDMGCNVMLWNFLFYASMGIVITFSVNITGVLLTFAFLILPSTFTALFAVAWRSRLLMAWAFAILLSFAGILFSFFFDFSAGPSVVMSMGIALLAASIIARLFVKIPEETA